jgi:uncharacterized protein YeaO (DUF488 family)
MPAIHVKRVYDPPAKDDGARILVDRLWPRGVAKADLPLDLWAKAAAPSDALRRWFHADPGQFDEFRRRYLAELANNEVALGEVRSAIGKKSATLLTASKNVDQNHATVLRELLMSKR